MIFEADSDQISKLDSVRLVDLMRRLMLSECRLVDIPLRAVAIPLQITVADGGEDGRVEWEDGIDQTDYFPRHMCIFQSKAQNLTPGAVKSEVTVKKKDGSTELNPAISDVIANKGAYIIFCSYAFTGQKIKKLKNTIRNVIKDHGANPNSIVIEIYDANKIVTWVNLHTSVALWLNSKSFKHDLTGYQTHDDWARMPDMSDVPWVDDGDPRFVPVNLDDPQPGDAETDQFKWTFEQAVNSALEALATNKSAIRIAGPSGFGKSRFVFEMFNRKSSPAERTESAAVIYADLTVVEDSILKLALAIADIGSPSILIVDDCPDGIHTKLCDIARRSGSRLRLITIDVETNIVQDDHTQTIRIKPANDDQVAAIAKAITPDLDDADVRIIQELSNGFPQMAVLAARHKADGQDTIRSIQQFVDRIVWGRDTPDKDAQKALEVASLFEWIGMTDRVGNDAALIATDFANMSEDAFVESIKSFQPRGFIAQRGDYLQVSSIPLAARLGARRAQLLPCGKLFSFFQSAPEQVRTRMLKRLRWLDTTSEAQDFSRTILSHDNFGNIEALNSDFGAKCLDMLVHIDPDHAMTTIDQVFGRLTNQELSQVVAGRRYLVWALEKLVFRRQSFHQAATLIRRLAAAENEAHISNNATGLYKQLYQIHLSGTEVGPELRLRVLDDGLKSEDHAERSVCYDALDQMLDTHHFTRGGGAEEIGSGPRLIDWQPETYGDIWDFYRASIDRLMQCALSSSPFNLRAKEILGSHIRGLLSAIPFQDVRDFINRITKAHGHWPEAIQDVNEWLYFDRTDAPDDLSSKIRSFYDELMPDDPVDLVIVFSLGWPGDFNDPDRTYDQDKNEDVHDHEYSARKVIELAEQIVIDSTAMDRALDHLVSSKANTTHPFARRIGNLSENPVEIFRSALTKVEAFESEANRGLFMGFIAGVDERNPDDARECIRLALQSPKLKDHAISIISAGKLSPDDLNLVISLLNSGDIEPSFCASLSYGRGMDHFPFSKIIPLLDVLTQHGAMGSWAVIDISVMLLMGEKKPTKAFFSKVKSVLIAPDLFDKVNGSAMDGHNFVQMVKVLLKNDQIDERYARALVEQIISLCDRESIDHQVFSELDRPAQEVLELLIPVFPNEVWGGVTREFNKNDPMRMSRLNDLVEPSHDAHLSSGILFALPSHMYINWVMQAPAKRAAWIVEWIPIIQKHKEDDWSWHPDLEAFISRFGDEDNVLPTLAKRMHPRTWWGSMLKHIEPFKPLLEDWKDHTNGNIQSWANSMLAWIEKTAIDERRRSEEDIIER